MLLALDLGTSTGWCLGRIDHGTWSFKPQRFEGGGMRYLRFRRQLDELHDMTGFAEVAFEEVRHHNGTDAAHVYGGLMGTLTAWCEERGIPYEGIPVGEIKKYFTGRGNANKDAMIAEARRRGYDPEDDNHADAIAIWHFVNDRNRRVRTA